jgi:hypothetical protein
MNGSAMKQILFFRGFVRAWAFSSLLLTLLLTSASWSAELVVRNVLVDIEFLPSEFDYSITDSNGTRSGSDSFDSGYGIAAGVRYSFARTGDAHGFILGGEFVGAQATYGSTGHLTDYGLRLDGGYGYALDDRWSINLLLRGGYGLATLDMAANSTFSAISVSGGAFTYGVALGVDAVIADQWQISTSIGYLNTSYSLSGNDVDVTIDRTGLSASIGVLYRISNLPRPLE